MLVIFIMAIGVLSVLAQGSLEDLDRKAYLGSCGPKSQFMGYLVPSYSDPSSDPCEVPIDFVLC